MTNDIQTFTKQVGKNLKSARIQKNLSIRQLASQSGVSGRNISRFEDGNHLGIHLKPLIRIAIALDMDFTEISK